MKSRSRGLRLKLNLTKRKQQKRKTNRKKTHRKSITQYGGKFNKEEIKQIKYALTVDKHFSSSERKKLIYRMNNLSQYLSEKGEFQVIMYPFLIENDEETIRRWLTANENDKKNSEPQTDKDESDLSL
jgi:hypothetical protein